MKKRCVFFVNVFRTTKTILMSHSSDGTPIYMYMICNVRHPSHAKVGPFTIEVLSFLKTYFMTLTWCILYPSAYGFGNVRVSSGNSAHRSSQNLAIWASQHMLFDPTKTFCFFYIYFIAKVLCCFGIRTEEIQLTALKNFQVSKALVVAAEKIPLNVPNHRFET